MTDSSSDVQNNDFKTQKDFTKTLAKHFNVQPGKSRAALLTYGSNPSLQFRFDGYKTISEFESRVDRAVPVGGNRRIDKALEATQQLIKVARPKVPKIVVLFVSGRQALGSDDLSKRVAPLRKAGVKTYVIAVGSAPDTNELRPLVSTPGDLFIIPSYNSLAPKGPAVAKHIGKSKLD